VGVMGGGAKRRIVVDDDRFCRRRCEFAMTKITERVKEGGQYETRPPHRVAIKMAEIGRTNVVILVVWWWERGRKSSKSKQ